MKKLYTIIATGLIYTFFLISFSLFDGIRFIEGIFNKLGLKSTTVEMKGTERSMLSDPLPNPPNPLPPPKNGG